MKNTFFSRICSGLLSAVVTTACVAPLFNVSAAADRCDQGTQDGYDWELWNQYDQGTANMQLSGNGTFSCSWSGIENVLFRTGKKWTQNSPQWDTLGGIKMDYEADYNPNGNSYLSVYGWTKSPLVEYYIVENWGTWRPPGGVGYKNTITVGGVQYDVYETVRNQQPSIEGTKTFPQYFSVRKEGDKSSKGTIDIAAHFAAWEDMGLDMGGLYEVSLVVEGYQSSGSATVKKNDITLGSGGGDYGETPVTPEDEVSYTTPSGSGSGVTDDFEGSGTDWSGRGDVSYGITSDFAHGGSKSLYVENRTDSWNGFTIASDELKAGSSYDISAFTGFKSNNYSSLGFTLGLQYDLSGETNYENLVDSECSTGKWTELATDFTIPSGATNISLYVQSAYTETAGASDLVPFFLDDVVLKTDGSSDSGTTDPGDDPVPSSDSLVGHFGSLFRVGTSVSPNELYSGADFIKKHFNSITPENELKPDAILDQNACQSVGNNVNAQVNLSRADQTLSFCEDNGIPVRGHTFIWHSQTPDWFFHEGFTSNGAYVSKEVMDQRIESFIKNTFEALKTQYPNLNIYQYDVCNELFLNDGGGMRGVNATSNSAASNWARIYGENNDEFVYTAFRAARKYAPAGCKLYINDYNEYIPAKTQNIYDLAMGLKAEGLIDGIGMQSHLDVSYPSAQVYKTALEKFLSTGLEVSITELDITTNGDYSAQADLFKSIFQLAVDNADQIPSFTVWGTHDPISWRSSQNPLLFGENYTPKEAYTAVMSIEIPEDSVSTTTTAPVTTTTTTTTVNNPDAVWGDANCNGTVEVADAVYILQGIADPSNSYFALSDEGEANADVNLNGNGIDAQDALAIQKFKAGIITSLPESYSSNSGAVSTTAPDNTPEVNNASFDASFEDGSDGWAVRGNTSISINSDSYCEGSNSLFVTGREDTWQGAAYELGSEFKPGKTYSFSAAALQQSGSSQEFRMTLQYTDASGEDQYSTVASETAASGSWVLLENTEYTIPEDAENLLLYIETAEGTCDFWIDAALGAAEGTRNTVNVSAGKVTSTNTGNNNSNNNNSGEITKINGSVSGGVWKSTADTSWIDKSKPMVAFTFDDGAVGTSANATSIRIQDALSENGFHATFFYVGNWIGSNQAEVLRAYNLGFEIGNHTMSHANLTESSNIQGEISQTKNLLNNIIGGTGDFLVRPPYLAVNSAVSSTAGVPLINCGIDTQDWNGASKDQIVSQLKAAMANGTLENQVVLMHETYEATAAAMEELLPYMKAQGWQVVSVSELFAANGKTLQAGVTYTSAK